MKIDNISRIIDILEEFSEDTSLYSEFNIQTIKEILPNMSNEDDVIKYIDSKNKTIYLKNDDEKETSISLIDFDSFHKKAIKITHQKQIKNLGTIHIDEILTQSNNYFYSEFIENDEAVYIATMKTPADGYYLYKKIEFERYIIDKKTLNLDIKNLWDSNYDKQQVIKIIQKNLRNNYYLPEYHDKLESNENNTKCLDLTRYENIKNYKISKNIEKSTFNLKEFPKEMYTLIKEVENSTFDVAMLIFLPWLPVYLDNYNKEGNGPDYLINETTKDMEKYKPNRKTLYQKPKSLIKKIFTKI